MPLYAHSGTDPYAPERRKAQRKAAASPLNGWYVTTAKAPAPVVFKARVTRFGVEIRRTDETRVRFSLLSDLRHDIQAGYVRQTHANPREA